MTRRRVTRTAVGAALLSLLGTATPAGAAPAADWRPYPTAPMPGEVSQTLMNEIDVLPDGSVFAAGYSRHDLPGVSEVRVMVQRWDGAQWVRQDTPDIESAPARDYMWGIGGTSASDVWVVGSSAGDRNRYASKPYAVHFDGRTWTRQTVPDPSDGAGATMLDAVSVSPTEVWAVGTSYPLESRGAVWHLRDGQWTTTRLPVPVGCSGGNSISLTKVAATADGRVFAAGECPTAAGWSGFVVEKLGLGAWRVVARLAGAAPIADLDVGPDGTVWAVGTQTRSDLGQRVFLLRGTPNPDGTRTWSQVFRPFQRPSSTVPADRASGVAVSAAGVTVVGERNLLGQRAPWIATWNGTRWQQATLNPSVGAVSWLIDVDSSPVGGTWASGAYLGPDADIVAVTARPR